MKKVGTGLILVLLVMFINEAFAQSFAVKGGLNLSSMVFKDNDGAYYDTKKLNPGFHVGLTVEVPIAEMFSFETGALISNKGAKYVDKYTYSGSTYYDYYTTSLIYFEVPLTAKVSYSIGSAKIYGVFGPYIGLGLSGKDKYESKGEPTETVNIKWGSNSETDNLKRLDYGLSIGAGVEIKSVLLGLSYGYGLANISSDTSYGLKINNRVLGLTVGYKFSSIKK
jgi:hypothetical protein